MDLNFRKAGNRLLKASKEATQSIKAGSDAAITGLKAGSDAVIESYNRANKGSGNTPGVVHHSRIIEESESEVHHERYSTSISVDTAEVARSRLPLRLQQEEAAPGGRSREAGIRRQTSKGDRRCSSAPCQGLTEFIK